MKKDYTIYCGKCFGLDKIKFVTDVDKKTYRGEEMIGLTFENDETFYIPVKVAQYAITDKETDLTSLREILIKPIVKEIIEVLLESQLKIEDFEFVLTRVKGSIQESIMKATDKLWGKDGNSITLADVDEILTNKKL